MKDNALLLNNQICFPLYVASRLTTQLYAPMLKDLGITYPQYLVMLVLWEKDHRSVSEISKLLYLESNTLTPLLKRLENSKFIHRTRSSEDGRSVTISLSEAGKKLKEKAVCIPEKIVGAFQGQESSGEEAVQFKNSLKRLIHLLESNSMSDS